MAELHVIGALRNKRAELAGVLRRLEQQLGHQRANLAHLDATMRLFNPNFRPNDVRPKQPQARNAWFRPGECLRLIYDELREATQPLTTRELAERIMRLKAIPAGDDQRFERIQKTLMWTARRRQALFTYLLCRSALLCPALGHRTERTVDGIEARGLTRGRGQAA